MKSCSLRGKILRWEGFVKNVRFEMAMRNGVLDNDSSESTEVYEITKWQVYRKSRVR